ncbi:MAG: ATP-dependent DNA helicase RecG [Leptospirales bacterium]
MLSIKDLSCFNESQVTTLRRQGIRTLGELFYYIPRRYVDRSQILDFKNVRAGETVTFLGKVASVELKFGKRRWLSATVDYQGSRISLVFFQAITYYKKLLQTGAEAAFSGKIDMFRGRPSIMHPEVELLSGDELVHTGKIIPIYKVTEGMRTKFINNRTLRQNIHDLLIKHENSIEEPLPAHVLEQLGLPGIGPALHKIHFPDEMEDVYKAKRRLAFDELIIFSAIMFRKKEERNGLQKSAPLDKQVKKTFADEIKRGLPFKLTDDQQKAIAKLKILAYENAPFGALLQGDVGSGKTLVALLIAMEYVEQGIQVALMAPTEILARQHYRNFIDYLSGIPFLQTELLLGAEKASERKGKLDRIARGDALIVVGTHSLIQEEVEFSKLGLVIIDEQQRFGVQQRETLRAKGIIPDVLSMSATPIPRSLTLTLYGDMEQIIIKEKPPGRKDVDTRLFQESELMNIYRGVKKYVDQGQQAYIVYPVIEDNDKTKWASVVADYDKLEKEIFKGYRLGLLHGRLNPGEKDRAMTKFKEGTIQILVATTVVEVGVDVPNASVMVIRNAEKFGLSQLHQLRGRVGRGEQQSYCILVESEGVTEDGKKRLAAMIESNDGFYLSQKDFEIRGSGELFNTKQAGVSEFKVADLRIHAREAEEAKKLIEADTALREKIYSIKKWEGLLKKGFILFGG